jgi:NADPH2:quinone reductase
MPGTPQAIVIEQIGGPEVMRLTGREPRDPGRGEALVRITAAGVNFIDVYYRAGRYPAPSPFVPGLEGAGVVEKIGSDVGGLVPGDRVAWSSLFGSYATHVTGPADRMVKVPSAVDDETAAALMLQGMTAHYLIHACRETKPGDLALVHAAAGGVGLLLTQMLKASDVRVIATVGSGEKGALARDAGADDIILYEGVDFSAEVRRLTGGRGVDVVYDGVGATTFDRSIASLRPRGLMCLYGAASGAVPPFDPQVLNQRGSLFLTRPSLAHYTADRAELELRASAVLDAVAAGKLNVRVGARYPLEQAAEAHRALEGRQTTGKVLLIP